jgi:hypothetical protein
MLPLPLLGGEGWGEGGADKKKLPCSRNHVLKIDKNRGPILIKERSRNGRIDLSREAGGHPTLH